MNALTPALVALLLGTGSAPYVRSRVDTGTHCLWWQAGTLTYNQSQLGNPVTGATAFTAISRAWQSWQQVMDSCGNMTLVEGPRVPDRTIGYDSSAPDSNKNVIMFRTQACSAVVPPGDSCTTGGGCGNKYDCWEHDPSTIALTTTTYDTNTGRIVDADVEFNAAGFYFTTVDSPVCSGQSYNQGCVAYDVQNAMTHEAGHALGLDHTSYPGSIMAPTSPPGDLSKRTIDPGSRSFVCDAYPRGKSSQDCSTQSQGGCTAAGRGLVPWTCGVALVMLALRRRGRLRR